MASQKSLAKILKGFREYHQYTQSALARRMRCAPSFVSEAETSKRTITLNFIGKYADFFACAPSEILYMAEVLDGSDCEFASSETLDQIFMWIDRNKETGVVFHAADQ